MKTNITNKKNIDTSLAVWLINNHYTNNVPDKYEDIPFNKRLSATTLLKPTRQLVLAQQHEDFEADLDITDLVAAKIGAAVHNDIEQSWLNNYKNNLNKLGYNEDYINNIEINPEIPSKEKINIYFEKRSFKVYKDYLINGQFDLIIDGQLYDFKTTSTYAVSNDSKEEDFKLQGSIYKWLNPDLIINDTIKINFIFTDWSRNKASQNKDYPQTQVLTKEIKLYSTEEIELFINNKLNEIETNLSLEQDTLIRCSDTDLWMSDPVYKYFSKPTNKQATKNFSDPMEANMYLAQQGKGVIKTVVGKPKRCAYCPVFDICKQKDEYTHD
jgi:hypothetical protein